MYAGNPANIWRQSIAGYDGAQPRNIQRLSASVMDQFSCAFMLFHYEDDTRWDWRFNFRWPERVHHTDGTFSTIALHFPGLAVKTADNFKT